MPELVSIIIPHYERVDLLVDTLNSIREQTYPHWEVCIVDDGSRTDTFHELQRLGDGEQIKVLQRLDRPKGPSACRNVGAESAKGEWLIFLDSDDLLAPWCLEQRLEHIPRNDVDFLTFPAALFKERIGDLDELWGQMNNGVPELERFLTSTGPWHTSSGLWRRQSFLDLGGFNEKVFYGDDSDLHTRALLADLKFEAVLAAVPDAFVRRGEQTRITSESGQHMFLNRQNRLTECAKSMKAANASAHLCNLWEGQFFQEAEFLLFNLPEPETPVWNTINRMEAYYTLPTLRRIIIHSYFHIALRCKVNAYALLRVARRLAMATLPASYFPSKTGGGQGACAHDTMEIVRQRMNIHAMRASTQ
ncbi:glycosyltransferase family 2 protein [Cerasicoccus maritimus]|uniref:glycosyltransferase family 2 protein n=1 Tax=Cerasicoccus maritimus TaxID=490089 RepID=UPI0028527DBC|nr:glycosyltransferase family A protein [Cerasicoccus maritimus]